MTMKITQLPPELSIPDDPARRVHVILVGAGGVGARLAPLVAKHLLAGDALSIVDHDIVESKNLLRQHFVAEDVGRHKAVVVAERAERSAAGGVIVNAYPLKVEKESALVALLPGLGAQSLATWTQSPNHTYAPVVLSAIDSRAGRRGLASAVRYLQAIMIDTAWIDCGNDMFSGQALVAAVKHRLAQRDFGANALVTRRMQFHGWQELAPNFLERADDDQVQDCAVRMDTQSVMANTWAATAAMTLAMPFITGAPLTSLGIAFAVRSGATRTIGVKAVVAAPDPSDYAPGRNYTIQAAGRLLD